MSVKVYEFTFSPTKKVRFAEPYGGGYGTRITSYWHTGFTYTEFYFYYWYQTKNGNYIQELHFKSSGGSTFFDTRSPTSTLTAPTPPYNTLSTEPRTAGWTVGQYTSLAPTVASLDIYTANVTANAYGTVSRSRLFYDASTQRSATATPNSGSSFIGWFLTGTSTQITTNDDFTVSANVITLKRNPVSADIAVEARFTAVYLLTAASSNTAHGQAYIGDSPSTDTSRWFEEGASAVIRAVASNADYKFSKWTLDGSDFSTNARETVTTASFAETYTAVFIPIKYTLDVTVQTASQGTVSVDGQVPGVTTGIQVTSLSGVTVRAVPAFGYNFLGWYKAGVQQSTDAIYSFTMPEAAVALEARFVELDKAPITVTKTKGNPGDTADAKDMGSVTQYHLDTIQDGVSASGSPSLSSNLYLGQAYKFVPAANSLYQFDGWYKTVDSAQVLIETGGIYVVDGVNLFVTPDTTAAITVNAQFQKRAFRTISAVASDSSVYVTGNDAEDADCTCTITAPPPDTTEGGDQWLSGQPITVDATQAPGWELRQWIVKNAAGTVIASKTKGAAGFGQTFVFNLTVNCQVIAISAYTLPANQFQIQALHKAGQDVASGTTEIHPCGDAYVVLPNGVMANVDDDSVCELTAIPANGYRFVAWRKGEVSDIVSAVPVFSFTVTESAIYYAEFEATGFDPLVLFEGGSVNRAAKWRGKTYVSSMPVNFSCAKVYAEGYPVALDVGTAQSPDTPHLEANVVRSLASDQDPFRLPSRRREKYAMVGVETTFPVTAFAVSTSMEDLKNG